MLSAPLFLLTNRNKTSIHGRRRQQADGPCGEHHFFQFQHVRTLRIGGDVCVDVAGDGGAGVPQECACGLEVAIATLPFAASRRKREGRVLLLPQVMSAQVPV